MLQITKICKHLLSFLLLTIITAAPIQAAAANRAVLGPLAGAEVNVYLLDDQTNSIWSARTDADGFFSSGLTGPSDGAYVLVAVSGGTDTDADDDGAPDSAPTTNNGTIHALVTVAEFNSGDLVVSALSDIAWRYSKNLVGQTDDQGLKFRLNDIARLFIAADLNGDGEINAADITAFSPINQEHKNGLHFDYQILFTENSDGNSIINAYHTNQESILLSLLEDNFGRRLSLYPAPDSRSDSVKVEVLVFGKGMVSSNPAGIDFDSERAWSGNSNTAYLGKDGQAQVTLTATPYGDTEILSWDNCDSVSEDLTRCICSLGRDRMAQVKFGYKEARVNPNLVDITRCQISFDEDDQWIMWVTADPSDSQMIDQLARLAPGYYLVSGAGEGLLRKVTAVQFVSSTQYILTTEDASLEEIIEEGTGVLSRKLTHGDLAGAAQSKTADGRFITPKGAFNGIPGVYLVPSNDPNDTVFKLRFGENPDQAGVASETGGDPTPITIGAGLVITGGYEFTIKFDWDVDYSFVDGLRQFKFGPTIKAVEEIGFRAEGNINVPDNPQTLGSFTFGAITFAIGPVPVVLVPKVEVDIGASASVEATLESKLTLTQEVSAGVDYTKAGGLKTYNDFEKWREYQEPTAAMVARAEAYIMPKASCKLYGVVGPEVPIKGYARFQGDAQATWDNDICDAGVNLAFFWGIDARFFWDIGGNSKIGKWLGVENVDIPIYSMEKLITQINLNGDSCQARPPRLDVIGDHISDQVTVNSGEIITANYTISNGGDEQLTWSALFNQDGVTSVNPSSGSLGPSEEMTVAVSVGASSQPIGQYVNTIVFRNTSYPELNLAPDEETGTTVRNVTILVSPTLAVPQLNQPTSQSVSSITLSWTSPDWFSSLYVEGYTLYQSLDPSVIDSWEVAAMITGVNTTSHTVGNLTPGITYYYRLAAYGKGDHSELSDMVQYTLPSPGLTVPIPISPASGSELTGPEVTVVWSVVSGATKYFLEITGSGGGSAEIPAPYHKAKIGGLTPEGGEGEYFWRVKAMNDEEETDFCEPQKFLIIKSQQAAGAADDGKPVKLVITPVD